MCGIAGFIEPLRNRGVDEREAIARRMVSTLARRGPDDEGVWADSGTAVALGHRRLAILDLSAEGHQPMHAADGRYVLTFNGEIYNFLELRRDLEACGHLFRGHSDTEVMLVAFSQWGFLSAVVRFVGMFALALWDRREGRLHLARDRVGEKPLYYGWTGNVFVFGSELKALRAHPAWNSGINRKALALLVRHGYIPSPHCIHENIFKLPPGCALTLTESEVRAREAVFPLPYWLAQRMAETGQSDPFDGSEQEATDRLEALFHQSVAQQMIADVPVGAFLSGGIDSSLVVAVMQSQSRRPIKTFSIGFEQESFNEAHFAGAVARHLGTDHTELYVRDEEMLTVIPRLPDIYDEPFADSSQIPTTILCRLAREQVKVSLSGDGGDELFGGYNHYRIGQRFWKRTAWIPQDCRRHIAWPLKCVARAGLNTGFASGPLNRILNRLWNLSDMLPAKTDRSLCELLMSPNRKPLEWLRDAMETEPQAMPIWQRLPDLLHRMMYLDLVTYLPDDILVKVDRAAMAVSLETRIPLLDHRIIEFAWSLPLSFKQRQHQGKWLLRKVLHRYVPPELVDRPKRGFAAPIAQWLRGPLRDWAEDLLETTRLRQEGFLNPGVVREKWQEHLSARRDWSAGLWHVLMFQAWLDQQKVAVRHAEATPVITTHAPKEAEACLKYSQVSGP